MSDDVDSANDRMLFMNELMVKNVANAKPVAMPTGVCLLANCGWPVAEGRRWCDADCRDQWEKERRRGKV